MCKLFETKNVQKMWVRELRSRYYVKNSFTVNVMPNNEVFFKRVFTLSFMKAATCFHFHRDNKYICIAWYQQWSIEIIV